MAVCIKVGPWDTTFGDPLVSGPEPRPSGIYRVIGDNLSDGEIYLNLEGFEWAEWAAIRFRKIKPDTEGANADDAAWLKDLLAKPRVSA